MPAHIFMYFMAFSDTRLGLLSVLHQDTATENLEDSVRLEHRAYRLRVMYFTTELSMTSKNYKSVLHCVDGAQCICENIDSGQAAESVQADLDQNISAKDLCT